MINSNKEQNNSKTAREGKFFLSLKIRKEIKSFLFCFMFLAIGGMWIIEYHTDGFIRLKGGLELYGWQAKLCIVSMIFLPLFAYCWGVISQRKNKKETDQPETKATSNKAARPDR